MFGLEAITNHQLSMALSIAEFKQSLIATNISNASANPKGVYQIDTAKMFETLVSLKTGFSSDSKPNVLLNTLNEYVRFDPTAENTIDKQLQSATQNTLYHQTAVEIYKKNMQLYKTVLAR